MPGAAAVPGPALAPGPGAGAARGGNDVLSRSGGGRPWKDADAFRDAFNELRKKNASFETRYYVGLDPKDPLRLPTKNLTMRTMRHTCITLNHDAGVPRELTRGITGHELDTIDQVLKCYAAVTADQAAAALSIRWPTRQRDGAPESHVSARATDCPVRSLGGSQQGGPKTLASLKQTSLGKWRPSVDETDN